ncbi:MAG: hypothetical protein ACP5G0_05430 [Desulfomonilia bacterium]
MALSFCLLQISCGGDSGGGNEDESPPPDITGDAILDLYLVDGGHTSTPPAPLAGYTLLDIDLNEGTGGNYIWLYYKMGEADGSEGVPVSKIYTVDEYDGETSQGGTKLPVNLNENEYTTGGHEPLWLYYTRSSWPVARCIVVYNATNGVKKYGPPEAEGKYEIVWVEELSPDEWKTPYADIPPDAQDLNEGESIPLYFISDYIYIGYGKD